MSKWVTFEELGKSTSGKTSAFGVFTKDGGIELGWVKWFGRWRKYSFFPTSNTIFEETCLRDIAEFIQEKTREHKAK